MNGRALRRRRRRRNTSRSCLRCVAHVLPHVRMSRSQHTTLDSRGRREEKGGEGAGVYRRDQRCLICSNRRCAQQRGDVYTYVPYVVVFSFCAPTHHAPVVIVYCIARLVHQCSHFFLPRTPPPGLSQRSRIRLGTLSPLFLLRFDVQVMEAPYFL